MARRLSFKTVLVTAGRLLRLRFFALALISFAGVFAAHAVDGLRNLPDLLAHLVSLGLFLFAYAMMMEICGNAHPGRRVQLRSAVKSAWKRLPRTFLFALYLASVTVIIAALIWMTWVPRGGGYVARLLIFSWLVLLYLVAVNLFAYLFVLFPAVYFEKKPDVSTIATRFHELGPYRGKVVIVLLGLGLLERLGHLLIPPSQDVWLLAWDAAFLPLGIAVQYRLYQAIYGSSQLTTH